MHFCGAPFVQHFFSSFYLPAQTWNPVLIRLVAILSINRHRGLLVGQIDRWFEEVTHAVCWRGKHAGRAALPSEMYWRSSAVILGTYCCTRVWFSVRRPSRMQALYTKRQLPLLPGMLISTRNRALT